LPVEFGCGEQQCLTAISVAARSRFDAKIRQSPRSEFREKPRSLFIDPTP
jgi:hypothetical protein